MSTTPPPDPATSTAAAPITRRGALAGVGAVWAAPAITVLAQAPAFASSSAPRITAVSPSTTTPASAYQRGPSETFTVLVTTPAGSPLPSQQVTATLTRRPGDTTSTTDWLSLSETGTTTTAVVTTGPDGTAQIPVRYLPGMVPTMPTALLLTAAVDGASSSVVWTVVYRAGRPGSPDPHGAVSLGATQAASHQLVLRNGRAYAFGAGTGGQLGVSGAASYTTPQTVATTTSLAGRIVTALSGSFLHSLALTSDGVVHGWGDSSTGQLGSANQSTSTPVAIQSGSLLGRRIVAVAAGRLHSVALASDGAVHTWGSNAGGQLGNGSGGAVPGLVTTAAPSSLESKIVTAIAAGSTHTLALTADGSVHAWGTNTDGQLGDGSRTDRSIPVAVATSPESSLSGRRITAIAAGSNFSLALDADGNVHAWGNNSNGRLGIGSTAIRTLYATRLSFPGGTATTILAIAAGSSHALALGADGTVYSWGAGGRGQLGDSSGERNQPGLVTTAGTSLVGKSVVAVTAGSEFSTALASDGTLHAWGNGSSGQLGNATTTSSQQTAVLVRPLP